MTKLIIFSRNSAFQADSVFRPWTGTKADFSGPGPHDRNSSCWCLGPKLLRPKLISKLFVFYLMRRTKCLGIPNILGWMRNLKGKEDSLYYTLVEYQAKWKILVHFSFTFIKTGKAVDYSVIFYIFSLCNGFAETVKLLTEDTKVETRSITM